ncbi:octopamine receptor Oamb-like [Exaiptasia diaphana]|uniref:G-protein coupled receptors family 1 profile domain-containing protein n=1 Tax=Exaiptasia diaphana TaxID=2652724 RepID=A0A913WRW8_EXADI|nr:octopamine receptor Oamb-like [Exaiptasia diaphana]
MSGLNNSNLTVLSTEEDDEVCSEEISPPLIAAGITMLSVMIVCGILGNSLVCISMVKCSFLRRTLSNYLVVSLALSDLLVCTSVLPFDIIYWMDFPQWTIGGYACNIWNSLFYLMMTASVMNLVLISGDRFIAVVYPFRYPTWVTYRVIKVLLTSVWVYSVGVGATLFVLLVPPDGDYYSFDLGEYGDFKWYLNIGNVLIPFSIMVLLYIKIYVIARHHSRRMSTSQASDGSVVNNRISETLRRELRIAKALGVIVLCFLLCWLPYVVLNFMTLNDSIYYDCNIELADTVFCWLAYMNSVLNPILYAYTNHDFRRAFKSIFSRFLTRHQVSDQSISNIESRL